MKKLLLLMVLPLIGCDNKDINFNDIHVNSNVSLPIGKVNISDSSLFAMFNIEDVLSVNSDDVLQFSIEDNVKILKTTDLEKLFTVREQNYNFKLVLPTGGTNIQVDVPTDDRYSLFTFYFNASVEERIDKLILPNGKLSFRITTSGNFSNLRGKILQITRNGLPIEFKVGDVITLDENCVIAPISKNGKDNVIELKLSGKVPALAEIKGVVSIKSDTFSYIKGFVGRKVIDPVITNFKLDDNGFSDFAGNAANAYFAEPQFDIIIDNKYDLPLMVSMDKLAFDNIVVDLKLGLGASKFFIAPLSKTTIKLNNKSTISGKGLSKAITKDLKVAQIVIKGLANPTAADLGVAYTPNTVNEIRSNQELKAVYDLILPFDFVIDNVLFNDGVDWDLGSLNNDKNIKYKEFAIAFSGYNQLPLDMKLHPYVTDNDMPDGVKSFLFSEPIEIKGTTSKVKPKDPSFVPYKFIESDRIVRVVDQNKVEKLLKSKKLFFEIISSTVDVANKNTVKLYSPSKIELGINVGLKADIILGNSNK